VQQILQTCDWFAAIAKAMVTMARLVLVNTVEIAARRTEDTWFVHTSAGVSMDMDMTAVEIIVPMDVTITNVTAAKGVVLARRNRNSIRQR